jgi:DNA repair protein RecN (Recombination protein N)
MLKSLQIKDYALIDNNFVEFEKGLNIITGETGAGKSIIIDAMGLLLGERASAEVVRKGAPKSVVEGIFDVEKNTKVKELLSTFSIEPNSELIVRREVSAKGGSRCFLNDTPVPLTDLKSVGNLLVDLHGQHEHQSLLRSETHIEMLDDFSDIEPMLVEYRSLYRKLNEKCSELKELRDREILLREKKELYQYQIREIDLVSPLEGEDTELLSELNVLENGEKLLQISEEIYQKVYDGENALYDQISNVQSSIRELSSIDKSLVETGEEVDQAAALIRDIAESIRSYKDKIDLDPERLENVRERLGAINLLKKKYGGSLKALNEYRLKIGDEFALAENYSEKISEFEKAIETLRAECGAVAETLSEMRRNTADGVEKEIVKALSFLGISDALFEVKIIRHNSDNDASAVQFVTINGSNYKCTSRGVDEIEFYISTNKGEDTKSLARVASGGEISRVMLALKTVLAKNEKLPLLIFDEIDTGVSGRIAQKVGQTLKQLAEFHQIISITHLPQIAGLADNHFAVEKKVENERVVSRIRVLPLEERIREVAKLMSGEDVTEASLNGARELMRQ